MKKLALVAAIVLTVTAVSTTVEAAGYRCAWRGGVRVCWYENTNSYNVYQGKSHRYKTYKYNQCYWTKGYWRHGHWHSGYRVCK